LRLGTGNFFELSAPGGITRAARSPFGVALAGDRRRCGVVEPFFYVVGSTH